MEASYKYIVEIVVLHYKPIICAATMQDVFAQREEHYARDTMIRS